MSLRFGTDGWRAVIADEFTFDNVRLAVRAVHEVMPASKSPVAVGHDTRFQSAAFARAAAEVLAAGGRDVLLTSGPCPTPAVSCQVVAASSPFGLSITASHNPPEFNGLKIKSARGASAPPEITRLVERRLSANAPSGAPAATPGTIRTVSFLEEQRRRLATMVDLERIRRAGLTVAFDSMHGAALDALERMLDGGATRVETLRGVPDPLFGGVHPEPLEANLAPLASRMRAGGADIGLATDGDGDRIGAFDEKGRFVTPLQIAPLLAMRMIAAGKRGEICKTFANTILLDRIAKRNGMPFSVHPIGFKHIAERMEAGGFLIGGEESGGIGIAGYLPERDGLLISLLLLELIASEGEPLSVLISRMEKEYGVLRYFRRDIPCAPEKGRLLAEGLKRDTPAVLGGMKVTGIDPLDGVKLLFGDDGWILARPSGTEPVLRVYCEAPTDAAVNAALEELLALVVR
jgi:phosphomannomutase